MEHKSKLILDIAEGGREDKESWTNFLRYLKDRGLSGVKLIASDKCSGLHGIIGDFFPNAKWQRCAVNWYQNSFTVSSSKHVKKHCRNAESDSCTGRPGGKLPYEHWTRLRTNNALERIMKEIRRRTRIIGAFPDGYSAMMLVGARLRHISTTKWGTRQYLNTCKLYKTV